MLLALPGEGASTSNEGSIANITEIPHQFSESHSPPQIEGKD